MRILGYVGEREKWRFLADATALLLPSWAEGFGMPILEAQAVGTPVVTGDTTAMPEVAGKHGALFVPSGDDEALADAMGEIAEDQALRERLSGAGKKNLERFSWERAARKTLEVLLGAMEAMD
jgi:glycosyltransferase involved in cell wall biosynthesis